MTTRTPPAEPAVQKGRPSRLPLLVMGAAWLGALVILCSVLITGLNLVDDGVFHLARGAQVTISSDGLTVYGSQRSSVGPCDAVNTDGGQRVHLDEVPFDIAGPASGITVHAIASTPGGMPAGRYNIDCAGVGPGVTIWIGDRIPLASLVIRTLGLGGCFVVGLVLSLVLTVKRSRRRPVTGRSLPGSVRRDTMGPA